MDKDAGAFGGVQLRFISKNNADDIYVWFTVRGTLSKDHLIDEQTVRVNMLNLTALQQCIGKAKELYDHRQKVQSNADGLK